MGRIKDIADATDDELQTYLDHLGWDANPFAHPATIDEYVLPSPEDIADVSSHIQSYTGPVLIHSRYSGAGKTTLLKMLLQEFDEEYDTIYIGEHNVTPYELVAIVADEIGVGKSSSTKLTEQKIRDADLNDGVLLGIDEFGLNDPDTIHVVQFLNDLDGIKVILTGMTSQWDAIGGLGSEGKAFQRRVSYRLQLEPFDRDQLDELIRRRIASVVDDTPDSVGIAPFNEGALDVIHGESNGVPAVATAACSELIGLGAYRYANGMGDVIDADLAESIEYADPEVE